MHHSFAVVIILAAPFVAAQSLSSIPSCALPAAEAGIQKTGCDLSNTTCICGATSFLETVKQQISTVCSTADQETTINTAQQYCSQAGVPLALPSSPSPSNLPYSTTPPYPTAMNATTPPPYALSNASSSLGMNTTNNNNTTTMPFTAAAAAAMRGTMQTVAMMVVGLSVVGGMLFLY